MDGQQTKSGLPYPPFVPFPEFFAEWNWELGQHITVIGPTGSGKTVLVRQLLRRRDYVVVLGIKNRDPELYGPFTREGYKIVSRFDPEPEDGDTHLIFRPKLTGPGAEDKAKQRDAFREGLGEIFLQGRWTVYADDVQYLSDNLKLGTEFETFWMLGRSEQISMVASTQEPVDIPVLAYGQATHLFLFQNPDIYRVRRMAELTGVNREIVMEVLPDLPPHEFLYVNKLQRSMLRSKVIRELEPSE